MPPLTPGRLSPLRLALLAGLALAAAPVPARAQMFDLQGLLECIDHPDTPQCRDRAAPDDDERPPTVTPTAPDAAAGPAAGEDNEFAIETTPPRPRAKPEPPPLPPPPPPTIADLKAALGRIQANRQSEADMALLEKQAEARVPAAVEVLAWCYLNGRGRAADPIKSYVLYGEAARLNVPNAKKNQETIFAAMSSDQRQRLLDMQSKGKAP
jgi:hypothetical protein